MLNSVSLKSIHFIFIALISAGFSVSAQTSIADTIIPREKHLIIGGVGDIMLGTAYPDKRYLPPGDNPAPLLESVKDLLSGTDILFANLEGPFSDYSKLAKRCRDTTLCYAFRVPEHYVGAFYEAGFNLVSLANNHIGDFGLEGRDRTISLFDSLGIKYAGPKDYPWTIFTADSIIYGFTAFSPNKGTLNINEEEYARSVVSMLNDSCDVVIVSFHGGAEGADHQHVTRETETFYGENRSNVYEFSHAMIDAGADIIFGHGPHVTRAIEVYKDRFIAYSMGNFCTYRRFNLSGPNGFAPIIKVKTDTYGKFVEADIIPVRQNSMGHVVPDTRLRVITKLQELIASDFPESVISLDNNGKVTYLDHYE